METKPKRGLVVKRKVGESLWLSVGEVKLIVEVRAVKGSTASIAIIADKTQVKVYRPNAEEMAGAN